MQSDFLIANATGTLPDVLSACAEFLVQLNAIWLRDKQARGLVPPCCTHCAEPPWVRAPVRYVPHHGAPVGTRRLYQDGPTMFAKGKGTCVDIAAYDVAALRVLKGKSAAVRIVGGPVRFHAVVWDGERVVDPSADIAARQGINVGGCGCAGGLG